MRYNSINVSPFWPLTDSFVNLIFRSEKYNRQILYIEGLKSLLGFQ